jgi:dual specificity protein kinase YAK1
VNDRLESPTCSFVILDLLGTGTFGQVFRCVREDGKDGRQLVAVKVVKSKPAYYSQGQLEIKIASYLNSKDPEDDRHIVRLQESFEYQGHVCLVFELLSMTLLDVLTQNQFRGLPLPVVQRFTRQILTALVLLEDCRIIHCDLKVVVDC